MSIPIHIVDDDQAVREGLCMLLESVDLNVITWANPVIFLQECKMDKAMIILLDVRMPHMSGISVLEKLREQAIMHPVILLTGHATVAMCRQAFKLGAVDFLEKPVDDEALLAMLQKITLEYQRNISDLSKNSALQMRLSTLTAREKEILQLILQGKSASKVIAQHLRISPRTIETHRANILAKLEVSNIVELLSQYVDYMKEK